MPWGEPEPSSFPPNPPPSPLRKVIQTGRRQPMRADARPAERPVVAQYPGYPLLGCSKKTPGSLLVDSWVHPGHNLQGDMLPPGSRLVAPSGDVGRIK